MIDTFIETLEYFPRGLVYVALGIVVPIHRKVDTRLRHSVSRWRPAWREEQ